MEKNLQCGRSRTEGSGKAECGHRAGRTTRVMCVLHSFVASKFSGSGQGKVTFLSSKRRWFLRYLPSVIISVLGLTNKQALKGFLANGFSVSEQI